MDVVQQRQELVTREGRVAGKRGIRRRALGVGWPCPRYLRLVALNGGASTAVYPWL
jgi:hypothetical protein